MMNPLEISRPSSPPNDPLSSSSSTRARSNNEHRHQHQHQRERVEEADAAVEMEITFEEVVGDGGEGDDARADGGGGGAVTAGAPVEVESDEHAPASESDPRVGGDEEALVPLAGAGLIRPTGSKDSDDGLSPSDPSSPCRRRRRARRCCRRPGQIGNCTVLCPALYDATGVGVVGPHWPGLACTFALLWGAASYFTRMALLTSSHDHHGSTDADDGDEGDGGNVVRYEWSAIPVVSVVFCVACTVGLILTACVDPGVVTRGDERQRRYREALPRDGGGRDGGGGWRWCDLCRVFQPPRAVHCPDCNLCVDGYDHHCPWMGTCIGRRNMRAFVVFNLGWLFYLIFVVGWVVRIFERRK